MADVRAVIFDMDGVLIEARDWHYEALNRALGPFGYHISHSDHLTTFDGLPTTKKLELLTRERGLPRELHPVLNALKQEYTTEIIHQKCKPAFAHEQALSALKSMGYKLALASNSVRATVELMMEKSNLRQYLDVVVSNQDVKNAKPDPEMYRTASAKLGFAPAECLVLEDNPIGIRAAEAAGCPVLVVRGIEDVNLPNILAAIARLREAT